MTRGAVPSSLPNFRIRQSHHVLIHQSLAGPGVASWGADVPGPSSAPWTPPGPTSLISGAEGTPSITPQGLQQERPVQTLLQLL